MVRGRTDPSTSSPFIWTWRRHRNVLIMFQRAATRPAIVSPLGCNASPKKMILWAVASSTSTVLILVWSVRKTMSWLDGKCAYRAIL